MESFEVISKDPLGPASPDPEVISMEPPAPDEAEPPRSDTEPPKLDELPPIDSDAPSILEPEPTVTLPLLPDDPSPLRISTSPPVKPEPADRDKIPPLPFNEDASPADTETSAPIVDVLLPALMSTLPANPPWVLSPLEMITEPVKAVAESPVEIVITPDPTVPDCGDVDNEADDTPCTEILPPVMPCPALSSREPPFAPAPATTWTDPPDALSAERTPVSPPFTNTLPPDSVDDCPALIRTSPPMPDTSSPPLLIDTLPPRPSERALDMTTSPPTADPLPPVTETEPPTDVGPVASPADTFMSPPLPPPLRPTTTSIDPALDISLAPDLTKILPLVPTDVAPEDSVTSPDAVFKSPAFDPTLTAPVDSKVLGDTLNLLDCACTAAIRSNTSAILSI